jgi:xylulokinase
LVVPVPDLLFGLDIGTSSSKAVLTTPDGDVVASAVRAHGLSLPRPGWAEHDADAVWWADVVGLCRELTTDRSDRIAAVGVSGIGPCILPIDRNSAPLRPAILYGIDTRASGEVKEVTERLGAEQILQRCGSLLSSQAAGPKLLWLSRHEQDVWAKTRRFLMASSFVVQRLTGEYVLDHNSASQCDPLYDISRHEWISEWADDVAPGIELPPLLWPTQIAGEVTPEAAASTGLPTGVPVTAGTVDAWAEALSTGMHDPGDTMLMYGSTMFLVRAVERPAPQPEYWTTVGVFPDSYTSAAGMATSGALTGWFRDLVGGPNYEELLAEARRSAPGSAGLLVLPYFAGERSPLFDSRARGAIVGLTLSHTRGDLYRALLEATAFGVRHILETMGGAAPGRIFAVGGGLKGDLWAQIVSDVTQLQQLVPRETIGASYGDAQLAAVASGFGMDAAWNAVAHAVEPNEQLADQYTELYDIYRDLYPRLAEPMHRLAELHISDAPRTVRLPATVAAEI